MKNMCVVCSEKVCLQRLLQGQVGMAKVYNLSIPENNGREP